MIVDSSRCWLVPLGEEDAQFYADAIERAVDPQMSVVSASEVALVIGARKREPGLAALDRFTEASQIQVVAFEKSSCGWPGMGGGATAKAGMRQG